MFVVLHTHTQAIEDRAKKENGLTDQWIEKYNLHWGFLSLSGFSSGVKVRSLLNKFTDPQSLQRVESTF